MQSCSNEFKRKHSKPKMSRRPMCECEEEDGEEGRRLRLSFWTRKQNRRSYRSLAMESLSKGEEERGGKRRLEGR